jgi:hypothetical protein
MPELASASGVYQWTNRAGKYELKFLTQVSLRPVLGICGTCSISFECALLVLTSILPGVVITAWLVEKRIGTIAG